MSKTITTTIAFWVLIYIIFPTQTLAAGIVPERCQNDISQCNLCDLLVMTHNIYVWILGISVLLAIGIITYAGIQMILHSAEPGEKQKERGLIINTLIALAIVFGSMLIVDQVLKAISGGQLQAESLLRFSCQGSAPNIGGVKTPGKIELQGVRGESDTGTGTPTSGPSTGGNPTVVSTEMDKLIGKASITEYGANPNVACASGVSKALVNARVLSTNEAQTQVGNLASLLYTRKGYTTIITDPSQLKPGDIVFVKGSAGQPADSSTWTTWGWGPVQSTPLGNAVRSRGEPGHVGMWTSRGFVNNRSSEGVIKPSTMYDFRFALRKQ